MTLHVHDSEEGPQRRYHLFELHNLTSSLLMYTRLGSNRFNSDACAQCQADGCKIRMGQYLWVSIGPSGIPTSLQRKSWYNAF